MSSFKMSADSIINYARDLFLSENFIGGIQVLRENIDGLEDKDFFKLATGISNLIVNEDNSCELVEAEELDELMAFCDIASNYDFNIKINDEIFVITDKLSIELPKNYLIANDENGKSYKKSIELLKSHNGELLFKKEFINDINKFLQGKNKLHNYEYDAVYVKNDEIYLISNLEKTEKNYVHNISVCYDNLKDCSEAFDLYVDDFDQYLENSVKKIKEETLKSKTLKNKF